MTQDKAADFRQPEKELFFWAILLNRKNMALLFWDEGKVTKLIALSFSGTLYICIYIYI